MSIETTFLINLRTYKTKIFAYLKPFLLLLLEKKLKRKKKATHWSSLTIGQLDSLSALCLLFTETFSASLVAFEFTKSEASCEPELQNHTSTSVFNFKV